MCIEVAFLKKCVSKILKKTGQRLLDFNSKRHQSPIDQEPAGFWLPH